MRYILEKIEFEKNAEISIGISTPWSQKTTIISNVFLLPNLFLLLDAAKNNITYREIKCQYIYNQLRWKLY